MPAATANNQHSLVISLISHTNVGKTTLARTLLRRDIGTVADLAHVTIVPEAHELISCEAGTAFLWDTPGFGSDLGKLVKRLRSEKNPIGWVLHQVWDRVSDKSLYCSQEAIRHIAERSDIVIYLVDASQNPSDLPYIATELEVIKWIGKPVLVFLNQTGPPEPGRELQRLLAWKQHLAPLPFVRHVSVLDAFTRSWTQEHLILAYAGEALGGIKSHLANELTQAWIARNLAIFEQSVTTLARFAEASLTDTEALPVAGFWTKMQQWVMPGKKDPELEKIQKALYGRLEEYTTAAVNQLIRLYSIDGASAAALAKRTKENFLVKHNIDEPLVAIIGGAAGGLLAGIAADALAGGMTLGGGALAGMLLGGSATFALAKGYNLAQTGKHRVRWTEAHFLDQLKTIIMLYLAVSHFGRGQGVWHDPKYSPAHWEKIVGEVITQDEHTLRKLWRQGGLTPPPTQLRESLQRPLHDALLRIFTRLYPDSAAIFR